MHGDTEKTRKCFSESAFLFLRVSVSPWLRVLALKQFGFEVEQGTAA